VYESTTLAPAFFTTFMNSPVSRRVTMVSSGNGAMKEHTTLMPADSSRDGRALKRS